LTASAELEGLADVVRRSLSRRVLRHYRGFAANQLAVLEATPTIKKLLYVLRTTSTGWHLLRTGELVCDLTELLEASGLSRARELVAAKRAGENTALSGEVLAGWKADVARAFERLDQAHASSVLPEEPPNADEVAAWLVRLRKARF
jgi:predicted nucleotidyltransferase